jgi:hypothetical protein
MKLDESPRSDNVEDQRGSGIGRGAGIKLYPRDLRAVCALVSARIRFRKNRQLRYVQRRGVALSLPSKCFANCAMVG